MLSTGECKRTRILAVLFLICCLAGGGTARPDTLSLVYLRPVAVLVVCYCLLGASRTELRATRAPLTMLILYAIAMLLQLMPLPMRLWADMPGHESFLILLQAEPGWRAASISPDMTLNSLVSLIVPLAALLLVNRLVYAKAGVLLALVASGLASGCVAVLQLALGSGSVFYLYRRTADGAVGLFSNPNHQAVMLACMLPAIALWLAQRSRSDVRQDAIGACAATLVMALIVITGSRSGLVAGSIGLICAFGLHYFQLPGSRALERRRYRFFYLAFLVTGLMLVGAMTLLDRDLAINRLVGLNLANDLRVSDFRLFVELGKTYFPFGSGAGTFDPAFRMIEPSSIVKRTFVNHAHNELLELVITIGLPGLLLLSAFLCWYALCMFRVIRTPRRQRDGYALLAGCVIAIMLLASLTDYLLRTPMLAAFFAAACAWLSMGSIAVKLSPQFRAPDPGRGRMPPTLQDDLES